MTSTDSANLLDRARQGDEAARGEVLEAYRAYLELLAQVEVGRRLRTKVDTADLVQETYLEAHKAFPSFRGTTDAELAGWLRGILAVRVSLLFRHYLGTQRRDVRREQALEIDLDQSSRAIEFGLVAIQSSPSERASRQEQGVLLADALAKLPADYREVIVLRHLEELSFPEVSERMGRTLDSVQKLWVRALARLRQLMPASDE